VPRPLLVVRHLVTGIYVFQESDCFLDVTS
jgi:hypothetical protein